MCPWIVRIFSSLMPRSYRYRNKSSERKKEDEKEDQTMEDQVISPAEDGGGKRGNYLEALYHRFPVSE